MEKSKITLTFLVVALAVPLQASVHSKKQGTIWYWSSMSITASQAGISGNFDGSSIWQDPNGASTFQYDCLSYIYNSGLNGGDITSVDPNPVIVFINGNPHTSQPSDDGTINVQWSWATRGLTLNDSAFSGSGSQSSSLNTNVCPSAAQESCTIEALSPSYGPAGQVQLLGSGPAIAGSSGLEEWNPGLDGGCWQDAVPVPAGDLPYISNELAAPVGWSSVTTTWSGSSGLAVTFGDVNNG
jgi:hypothetical protein